jgi:hypothetical protein
MMSPTVVYYGQSAALIDEVLPAAQVVEDVVAEAEAILRDRLPSLVTR